MGRKATLMTERGLACPAQGGD